MDQLISARRPDLVRINPPKKRTCLIVDLDVPADHRVKLKFRKNKDKNLDFVSELKKNMEHESDSIPIVIGVLGTFTKGLVGRREDLEITGQVN